LLCRARPPWRNFATLEFHSNSKPWLQEFQ
jgi:hypothetical protein